MTTDRATAQAEARPDELATQKGHRARLAADGSSSQDTVLGQLRRAILSGDLAPGARLYQEEVARRLGVSRSPVREAFFRLEAEGLVTVTPQKGAVVASLDLDEVVEIHELRAMLEGYATQLAAEQAGPALLARLQAILTQMDAAQAASDVNAWVELNRDFHYAIYEVTGRRHLIRLIKSLSGHMMRHVHLYAVVPHLIRLASDEHHQIYRALHRQDGMGARNVVEHHIRRSCHSLLEHLQQSRVPGVSTTRP